MTDGMKWFLLAMLGFFVFFGSLVGLTVWSGKNPPVFKSDYQYAKESCGSAGLKSYDEHYDSWAGRTSPKFICK